MAFSNADGGVLLLGVESNGKVVGVARSGERAKDVRQALRDVQSPGRCEVHEIVLDPQCASHSGCRGARRLRRARRVRA